MRYPRWMLAAAALALLSSCIGGLSSSVRRRAHEEHAQLASAARTIEQARETVRRDVAGEPALFTGVPEPASWTAKLQDAQTTLGTARQTDSALAKLVAANRRSSEEEADRLLLKESTLRLAAVKEAIATGSEAEKWIDFRRHLSAHLDRLNADHAALAGDSLAALHADVSKAESDWPAKKAYLETRLSDVVAIPRSGEAAWQASADARAQAATGTISGPALACLIETSDNLAQDRTHFTGESGDLETLTGQLYYAWDKILVDLDRDEDNRYRERIRTVRTHFSDVASKQTETSSSEAWIDVPEAKYRAVEDDLGMAIAHKDAGRFDSEVVETPEPAGFAYIAPEAQGSNQYGYWSHDESGHSVWSWLPQYLILRELLWHNSYRPVILEDYRGYTAARSAGRTYFGRSTPASPTPEYGTQGTLTRRTYAGSRYVQSGGFGASAYASHSGASAARSHSVWSTGTAGKRFGTAVEGPSGRRFGRSPGPSRGFGRSFGRRR